MKSFPYFFVRLEQKFAKCSNFFFFLQNSPKSYFTKNQFGRRTEGATDGQTEAGAEKILVVVRYNREFTNVRVKARQTSVKILRVPGGYR